MFCPLRQQWSQLIFLDLSLRDYVLRRTVPLLNVTLLTHPLGIELSESTVGPAVRYLKLDVRDGGNFYWGLISVLSPAVRLRVL